MMHLYQLIQERVAAWWTAGYTSDCPTLVEILDYITLPGSHTLRLLRAGQFRTLETYWYLRLSERTPQIFDLYQRCYPRISELLEALGLQGEMFNQIAMDEGKRAWWKWLRTDESFVKARGPESVHETLALGYPNYIFALAMR